MNGTTSNRYKKGKGYVHGCDREETDKDRKLLDLTVESHDRFSLICFFFFSESIFLMFF